MIKIKKRSGPISRILFRPKAVPAIYLLPSLPTTSNDLPPARASNPNIPVYLAFQPADAQLSTSLPILVGSYPAFSPLPLRAVVFFYMYHNLAAVFQLRRAVLYVARTFLSHVCASDRPACFERETGVEPATCGLGSRRSANCAIPAFIGCKIIQLLCFAKFICTIFRIRALSSR